MRLGTISPKTSERYVIAATAIATPAPSAVPSLMPRLSSAALMCPPSAAPPKAPAMIATSVMPIWMVEGHPGARVAFLGTARQPVRARGNHGQLGHGEHAVNGNEYENDGDIQG
jgi:hypothetical protein